MSQKFKSDIETQAGLIDSFGFTGTAGQVLSSTGTKTEWITPPQSPGGGGSSQVFYFNGGTASSVGGYYQMSPVANTGTAADFTINANGYIASFLTDVASPNQLNIPAGNWNFEIYFSASSEGGSPSFYVELYKYSSGGVFTLIASSSAAPEGITNGTAIDAYFTPLAVPTTTLLATDRLAVRVYVTHSGRTITMYTQNGHLSEVITTFSTGLTALNGLTEQVQYFSTGTVGTDFNIASAINTHTFNVPTASAVNRGALSSADWSMFNGKFTLPSLTSGSVLFSNGTTIAQDNSNFFWDDTNNRLGIGTSGPTEKLSVSGTIRAFGAGNAGIITSEDTQPGGAAISLNPQFSTGVPGIQTGNSPIAFYTNNSEKMRITSGGNVGINTTSPNQKLHVNGATQLGDINPTTNFGTVALKVIEGTVSTGPTLGSGAVGAQAVLYSNGAFGMYTGVNGVNGNTWMQSQRNDGNTAVYSLLFQPSGGNVGIGTSSPVAKLDIGGASGEIIRLADSSTIGNPFISFFQTSTRRSYIQHVDSGDNLTLASEYGGIVLMTGTSGTETEKMRITATGNVGIGTTSPTAIGGSITTLDIKGASGGGIRIGVGGGIESTFYSIASGSYLGTIGSVPLNFQTNNSVKATITANGSFGVGTTSPHASAILHLRSTTQGFLPPVMRTEERNGISSPAIGLMIFNETEDAVQVYTGEGWRTLAWA